MKLAKLTLVLLLCSASAFAQRITVPGRGGFPAAGTNIVYTTNAGIVTINAAALAGTGDFKADGSVPMTGDLDMDGNNITNVGSLTISGTGASAFDQIVTTNGLQLLNVTGSRFLVSDASGRATNDVAATGTGAPVRATSPVLTTPNIGAAIGASLKVDALAYDATSWNGSTNVPTRDDIRDKIESMGSGGLGYILPLYSLATGSLTDNSTYYFGASALEGHSGVWANVYGVVPKAGTIKWISFRGRCTAGSAEMGTNYLRLNDSTDTLLATNMQWNATRFVNIYSNLNITVSAGDQIAVKVVTPTYATDPSGACATINVWIE